MYLNRINFFESFLYFNPVKTILKCTKQYGFTIQLITKITSAHTESVHSQVQFIMLPVAHVFLHQQEVNKITRLKY